MVAMREVREVAGLGTVKTFGPKGNPGKVANIILVGRKFADLGEFVSFNSRLVREFKGKEPHVFLYPELPFANGYSPSRKQVRHSIVELQGHMRRGSDDFFAFSIHEGLKEKKKLSLLQTGFVVGPQFLKSYSPSAQGDHLTGASPFPRFASTTGHLFEYRISHDAYRSSRPSPTTISLVSTKGFDPSRAAHLLASSMVVANDLPGGKGVFFEHPGVGSLAKDREGFMRMLESRAIRLHTVR